MKKTFTANISGTVFHIEEDAYDQLQRYLANLRAKFSGSPGSDEIMADIEARIAELFSERLQGRQVVTTTDVEQVKAVMGQPEDFEGTGEEASAQPGAPPPPGGPRRKRLFRDPDDHWAGGVIGGIAAYFNTDPLWFRIAFVIFLVLGWGSPFLIYCVFWVLVPKAETPAEKLEMRGEPVTADNIKRVFDEGAERMKAGAHRMASEAQEIGTKWSSGEYRQHAQRVRSNGERFFRSFFRVLGKVVGVLVLLFGALLAFLFIAMIAGGAGAGWYSTDLNAPLRALLDGWFVSPGMAFWAWVGVAVLCFVPVVGLILAGFRLLFTVHVPRWLGWTLIPLWFASIILLAVIGIRQLREFNQRERLTDTVDLPMPRGRILHLAALHDPWFGDSRSRYKDELDMIEMDGDTVRWESAALDVQESPDSLFHLEVVRAAQGATFKEANQRAQAIGLSYTLQDSLLSLSPVFNTLHKDQLRGQAVRYIVRVPLHAAIRFGRGTARMIYDIHNITNTWDSDMVGRVWTMTAEGLRAGTPDEVRKEEASPAPQGTVPVGPDDDRTIREQHRNAVVIQAGQVDLPSLYGLLCAGIRL